MTETNSNARIEAFSDGVFAIALTLLIIDIKLPVESAIHSTSDFWHALQNIGPSIFAFVLSFAIIFITWVNHHNSFKLVNKSSSASIYANGFLLLTVVFMPFPTALLGQYLLTDHASPAVILYNAVIALQSIGWVLLGTAALKTGAAKNEKTAVSIRQNTTYGYYAFTLYTLLAIMAFWIPLTVAIITTLTWIFWLVVGIRMKHE